MYLFVIGSLPCPIPRLLDGSLGIIQCVSYVNAIIPCNCLVFLERQRHLRSTCSCVSESGGPWVRGGGRGKSQEPSDHACKWGRSPSVHFSMCCW